MTCDYCYLFHDGVWKGECRCGRCDCLWNYNRKLKEPQNTITQESQS